MNTSTTVPSVPPAAKRERLEAATYRIPEAADRAGVGERTLWRWLDLGIVPGVLREGKVVRISKKLFDEWIDGGAAKRAERA